MSRILKVVSVMLLFTLSVDAWAATFTIAAFQRPNSGGVNWSDYEGSTLSALVMDVITNETFTCGGSNTNKVRIIIGPTSEINSTTNLNFLIIAELIAAAKNDYAIETVGAISFLGGQINRCLVTNYYIYE